jgi:hypothetical protein
LLACAGTRDSLAPLSSAAAGVASSSSDSTASGYGANKGGREAQGTRREMTAFPSIPKQTAPWLAVFAGLRPAFAAPFLGAAFFLPALPAGVALCTAFAMARPGQLHPKLRESERKREKATHTHTHTHNRPTPLTLAFFLAGFLCTSKSSSSSSSIALSSFPSSWLGSSPPSSASSSSSAAASSALAGCLLPDFVFPAVGGAAATASLAA